MTPAEQESLEAFARKFVQSAITSALYTAHYDAAVMPWKREDHERVLGSVLMLQAQLAGILPKPDDASHGHLIGGEFQSDKYPSTPRGKVPLSVKDPTAQDLLWEYAQRRRAVDAGFAADLETALCIAGYRRPEPEPPIDRESP